jgi:hypothetical protein
VQGNNAANIESENIMRDTFDMAREAGFNVKMFKPPVITAQHSNGSWVSVGDELKAFEALVRADERAACAKVCDEQIERSLAALEKTKRITDQRIYRAAAQTATWNAAAIRARGQA